MHDAVLFLGFGGPETPEQVRPFLDSVLKGVKIPQARLDEVLHHYEVIGGVSPYNAITRRQKEALEGELSSRGFATPVVIGYRHSNPSMEEALHELRRLGAKKVAGFVLSCLRSYSSFGKYVDSLRLAQKNTGTEDILFVFTEPFHSDPLFIEAQADQVRRAVSSMGSVQAQEAYYLFSAHSIPCGVADESGYHRQFEKISELVAQKLGLKHWGVAYQSRSGSPKDPWLEPSVDSVLTALDAEKFKTAVLIPAGFLCDNVEVVYDLDTEAREICVKRGIEYARAKTVTDHPQFIRLIADLIQGVFR